MGAISESLGYGDPDLWFVSAALLLMTVVATVAVFILMGMVRNRCREGSTLRDFIEVTRAPVTYLVLFASLLENMSYIIPGSVSAWFDSVDTAQSVLVIAILLWVMLRYINRIEQNIQARAASDGGLVLPVIGEKVDRVKVQMLFKSLRAFVAIIIALMFLQAFGVSITGLLAFGGVGGIVVGFAARDLISNAFVGLRIMWSRPFDVGDWIKCESIDVEGVVEAVGWQITQVRTFDKRPLYVPNSILANAVIENPQRMTNRRFYEYFNLRYEDMERMPKVLEDVRRMLAGHEEIAKDQIIMVNLDRFGDHSIDFFVYCMTVTTNWQRFHEVKEDLLLQVAKIVADNGADFAFPTRTVIVEGGDAAQPEKAAAGG